MTMLSRRTLLAVALPACGRHGARGGCRGLSDPQVTFVVPFAPGGGTDILARMVGQKLEQRLGKPFVVENRPGAGTIIATNFVAKSPPDGYTIAMTVSSLAIDVDALQEAALRSGQGFGDAGAVAPVPFVLVVSPSLPVTVSRS